MAESDCSEQEEFNENEDDTEILIEIDENKYKRPLKWGRDIIQTLNSFRLQGDDGFCDVKLEVGGEIFPAHRCILAANSDFFKTIFRSGLEDSTVSTLKLPAVSSKAMPDILEFFYTQQIVILEELLVDLLEASCFLLLPSLKRACEESLTRKLSIENCLNTKRIASKFDTEMLMDDVEEFINKHFCQIVEGSQEYLDMSAAELKYLLADDNVRVEEEAQVLDAVIRWVEQDLPSRQTELPSLLENVRLHLMPSECLEARLRRDSMQGQRELCVSMIDKLDNKDMAHARSSTETHSIVLGANVQQWHHVFCWDDKNKEDIDLSKLPRHVEFTCVAAIDKVLYFLGASDTHRSRKKKKNRGKKKRWTNRRVLSFDVDCLYAHSLEAPEKRRFPGWKKLAPPQKTHCVPSLATLDGKLYLVGEDKDIKPPKPNRIECYNPLDDSWSLLPALKSPRTSLTLVATESCILALGGLHFGKKYNKSSVVAEEFNPATNQWKLLPSMKEARQQPSAVYHRRKVYALGGHDESNCSVMSCEIYDPEEKLWSKIADLPSPISNGQAAFILRNELRAISVAEDHGMPEGLEYDATTDEWKDVCPVNNECGMSNYTLCSLEVKKFDLQDIAVARHEDSDSDDSDSSSQMESE